MSKRVVIRVSQAAMKVVRSRADAEDVDLGTAADTLIEGTPEVAAHHALLGRIYREQDDLDAAVSAFETALKLDEEDLDARRALASVRIGARNAARGGTS